MSWFDIIAQTNRSPAGFGQRGLALRRLTRLRDAFSKKLDNLKAAAALHFAHYNLCRIHGSLRITPAMAAGVTDRLWGLEEIARLAD